MRRVLVWALVWMLACVLGCGTKQDAKTFGFERFGPLNGQGAPPATSFVGVVDPTNTVWSGGMVACTAGCSAIAAPNATALLAAIAFATATTTPRTVYLPPGEYPLPCSVDLGGASNLSLQGWNATLRLTGTAASCAMLLLHNDAHVKIEGVTFSMRDATSATTDTVAIKLGDGGTTTTDDIEFMDVAFTEGVGGDYIRMDGGTSVATVTRVSIERSRFETSARAAIDVRPGVQQINVAWDFFRNNTNRDIYFEDTGDGPIGQATITGNFFERATTASIQAVTLSGHGGANVQEQTTFTFNRIMPIAGQTTGGGSLEAKGLARTMIAYNTIITDRSGTLPSIAITGAADTVSVIDNYVDRRNTAGNGAVVQVASDGTNAPTAITIRGNRVLQHSGAAPGIDVSGCARCTVSDNNVTYHAATVDSGATGFVGIYCSGSVTPCSGTYIRNRLKQDDQDIKASLNLATVTTNDNTVVEFRAPGQPGNTATLQFIGDSSNAAGSTGGSFYAEVIHYKAGTTTVAQAETLINSLPSMHVKVAGTATNVLQAGDAFAATNLAGAVAAGRPLAGIEVLRGTQTTVNRLVLRDNWIDGARAVHYVDADGAAQYPEGYPLVSGDGSVNTINEFEGGITTYRTETTADAETVASGALSITKHVSYVSTSGTVAYTYADPVVDGFLKCVRIKSATSSPAGTLTPSHLADGTVHTITWNSSSCSSCGCPHVCLAWDATNATNRVVSSCGVTVN